MPPKGTGGPTAAVTRKIVDRVAKGCSVTAAGAASDVPQQTVSDWLRRGGDAFDAQAEGEKLTGLATRCLAFRNAIDLARAKAEAFLFDRLLVEMDKPRGRGNWLPWLKLLEIRFPETWGTQQVAQVAPPGESPISLDGLTKAELVAFRQLLLKAKEHADQTQQRPGLRAV